MTAAAAAAWSSSRTADCAEGGTAATVVHAYVRTVRVACYVHITSAAAAAATAAKCFAVLTLMPMLMLKLQMELDRIDEGGTMMGGGSTRYILS